MKKVRGEPMTAVDEARALAGQGFDGGVGEASTRQVTVLAVEAWAHAEAMLGVSVDPALRRANLLVAGVDLAGTAGRVLRVGDLRLEITGETKPCYQMDAAVNGLRAALEPDWRGGAHGVVLNDATVRTGDPVGWD
jgi:MOSC domain-containing protein YiiM